MKFEVKMTSAHGSGKHAPAFIHVKFKPDEPVFFDVAFLKAVRSNLGKAHTIKVHGMITMGKPVPVTVKDRYQNEYPYIMTLNQG